MFKKLRNKILMTQLLLTLLVVFSTFVALFSLTYWTVKKDNERKLIYLPSSVATNGTTGIPAIGTEPLYMTNIVADGGYAGSVVFFKITVDASGTITKENANESNMEDYYRKAVDRAWKSKSTYPIVRLPNGSYWQARAVEKSGNQFDLYFIDVSSSQKLLNELLYIFAGIVPFVLILVFFISKRTADKGIQPIVESWEKQKQFISDASHELKTPLAVINTNLDAYQIENDGQWIENVRVETSRMNKLVNELLYLSKTEHQTEQFSSFDFSKLVTEACIRVEALAYEKKLNFDYEQIENHLMIHSDEEKLQKLLSILLDNAIKYTDQSGKIEVALKRKANLAELRISNTGVGISKDKLPHIFDRFYRGDSSRKNDNDSYGLGLAIAKNIAERVKGNLTAKSTENEKTTFTLSLKIEHKENT